MSSVHYLGVSEHLNSCSKRVASPLADTMNNVTEPPQSLHEAFNQASPKAGASTTKVRVLVFYNAHACAL